MYSILARNFKCYNLFETGIIYFNVKFVFVIPTPKKKTLRRNVTQINLSLDIIAEYFFVITDKNICSTIL